MVAGHSTRTGQSLHNAFQVGRSGGDGTTFSTSQSRESEEPNRSGRPSEMDSGRMAPPRREQDASVFRQVGTACVLLRWSV